MQVETGFGWTLGEAPVAGAPLGERWLEGRDEVIIERMSQV